MTGVIDSVCEDLRHIFTGYKLLNKAGILQEVRVFPQYIPQPAGVTFEVEKSGLQNYAEEDYEKNFPCVLVKLINVTDQEENRLDMNRTQIKLLFGVYDANPEGTGWRDIAAMMEKVRQHWLSNRIIERKFRIQMPLKSRLLESETFPVYFGEMEAALEYARPGQRNNIDYIYRGYMSNG